MDNVVKDVSELTKEEKAELWERYVRSEVGALLDMFLPRSIGGNVGVRYAPHVIERTEAGDLLNKDKADAVVISLVFEFEEPLDLTKPRVEDTEDTTDTE
jgi:hypothetical protein